MCARVKLDTYPPVPLSPPLTIPHFRPPIPMYHATSPTHRHRGANRERIRLSVLPPGERTVPPKYVIISTGDTGIPRPREEFDQNVSRYSAGMPGELRVSPRLLLPPFLRRLRFLRLLRRVCPSHPPPPPPFLPLTVLFERDRMRDRRLAVSRLFSRVGVSRVLWISRF